MSSVAPLGVGLGYRTPIRREILQHLRELDFLEVVTDSFFQNEAALRALSSMIPVVPHSLNLSVGSTYDAVYVEQVKRMVDASRAPWFTDHLAFTHADGLRIGHLAPIPYTEESLDRVAQNVKRVQGEIDLPFGLENITMPFYWPTNTMEEHEFIDRLSRRTGCYILLDLENVRVNAANHGRGGRSFLDKLPLERIIQVHIAGGSHREGLEQDTHSAPVSEETWGLLQYLCELRAPPGILIERDQGFPPFPDLLGEVRRARGILKAASA